MSDQVTNLDEDVPFAGDTITLEDASAIVHDGLELLECVDSIYHQLDQGILRVETESGSFNIQVTLDESAGSQSLADQHGGQWSDHPTYGAEDWRLEVENHNTRLGYWEWVQSQIDAEAGEVVDFDLNRADAIFRPLTDAARAFLNHHFTGNWGLAVPGEFHCDPAGLNEVVAAIRAENLSIRIADEGPQSGLLQAA